MKTKHLISASIWTWVLLFQSHLIPSKSTDNIAPEMSLLHLLHSTIHSTRLEHKGRFRKIKKDDCLFIEAEIKEHKELHTRGTKRIRISNKSNST